MGALCWHHSLISWRCRSSFFGSPTQISMWRNIMIRRITIHCFSLKQLSLICGDLVIFPLECLLKQQFEHLLMNHQTKLSLLRFINCWWKTFDLESISGCLSKLFKVLRPSHSVLEMKSNNSIHCLTKILEFLTESVSLMWAKWEQGSSFRKCKWSCSNSCSHWKEECAKDVTINTGASGGHAVVG